MVKLQVPGFWSITCYNIGGLVYSLDDIEHGVLRANKGHSNHTIVFSPHQQSQAIRQQKRLSSATTTLEVMSPWQLWTPGAIIFNLIIHFKRTRYWHCLLFLYFSFVKAQNGFNISSMRNNLEQEQLKIIYRILRDQSRIHFALNCGAKSCPPIRIYKEDRSLQAHWLHCHHHICVKVTNNIIIT